MKNEFKVGSASYNLIRSTENFLADTNRLVAHPPLTKDEAIIEYQALVDQAERLVLKTKDLKHEATGRF
ncbi:hypothetical protein EFQ43_00285 [Limosilactobacillus fermentum]|nr:hypothetical protein [Limosilactobacillus fermentum]